MIDEDVPAKRNIFLDIGKDFCFVAAGSSASFLLCYFRGIRNAPTGDEVVSFIWPVGSWSFWCQLAFIGLVLPGFYIFYTLAAYAVREWLAKVLRWAMRCLLISLPFFLFGQMVVYYAPHPEGGYVVQNNGTVMELKRPFAELGGEKFVSYRFHTVGGVQRTVPFLPSERPKLPKSVLKEKK